MNGSIDGTSLELCFFQARSLPLLVSKHGMMSRISHLVRHKRSETFHYVSTIMGEKGCVGGKSSLFTTASINSPKRKEGFLLGGGHT